MPRLTGPQFSLQAKGTIGKTVTYSHWKGLPYSRVRVIPINRKSTGQKTVRSVLGTIAKAVRVVLTLAKDVAVPAMGSQFFIDANKAAPAGNSWVSFLQMVTNSIFASKRVTYEALGAVKALYETQAGDSGMSDYIDKSGVTQSAGFQLFLLANFAVSSLNYTGFTSGIDSATAPQLVTFAEYLTVSA